MQSSLEIFPAPIVNQTTNTQQFSNLGKTKSGTCQTSAFGNSLHSTVLVRAHIEYLLNYVYRIVWHYFISAACGNGATNNYQSKRMGQAKRQTTRAH